MIVTFLLWDDRILAKLWMTEHLFFRVTLLFQKLEQARKSTLLVLLFSNQFILGDGTLQKWYRDIKNKKKYGSNSL